MGTFPDTFPLPIRPTAPWTNVKEAKNTYFGAGRTETNESGKPYPIHGACDLLAPKGTNVLAVQHGTILWIYKFYKTTWAMEVQHDDFIARYTEISPHLPTGIIEGKEVSEGDVIATVGEAMLHFEMFKDRDRKSSAEECWGKGKKKGNPQACLTNESHATKYTNVPQENYERRDDLMDPTPYLNEWYLELAQRLVGRL